VRIAILSDIHGNVPALEAVIDDIARHSPDETWCGGDLGWGGPWAAECIARVRSEGWPTIKGNTDVWITGDIQGVVSEEDRAPLQEIAAAHEVSQDDVRWLIELPLGHSGPGSVLLVHGTPHSPFDAPLPDASPSEFEPYENAATLVVYAHVHRAFLRRLADGTLVCNTGSVGMPMDGDTASYALIDRQGPDLTVRHRRVEYDRKRAIARAREVGGPIGQRFLTALNVDP
jgi:predicted phosphodiesterase